MAAAAGGAGWGRVGRPMGEQGAGAAAARTLDEYVARLGDGGVAGRAMRDQGDR